MINTNGAADALIGAVRVADITQEMQTAYLDYAMSVIVARALPDVRDGLKPVHRRILYAMWHDLSLTHDKPHKKSARIVGEVLGKYHPHGDAAVYDAMVRMAQPFSLRYPLIDGQGNFGSIDGDNAAAMRYTEARLARIADLMLEDLEKETVDWHDNFDNTLREPDILPAALPNLLINGSSGIAVGMATNIPPHNLGEVVDALAYMIDHYDQVDAITTEALMRFIKGPDFPTGGILYRYREESKGEEEADAIAQGYSVGKSRLILQAKAHFEEISRGRTRIVVTELPYQTNKTALLERIADLVRDGKIEGVGDLRDESDRTGMRIVIELTRGADPKAVLADLFKYTPLQQTFGMQLLALVDGQPRLLSLKRMLQLFIQHRQEIIRRRSEFELKRAKERAHIVEGLLRALDILDEVIQTIRRSQTVETARNNLMHNFKFTELQAQAILDMQLRRLAALERKKLQEEYKELKQRIAYLEDLLAHPHKVLGVIKEELLAIKQEFGDARRTQIVDRTRGALTTTDLLPDQRVWVSLGKNGDLRRQAVSKPGASIVRQIGKDSQVALLSASTRDYLYVFSKDGRCSRIGVHEIPEEGGKKVSDLTGFTGRDAITAALALPRERNGDEADYLFLVTEQGMVKRVRTEDVQSNTGGEFTVMNVDDGDRLLWALRTQGGQEVILVSAQGQSIRFSEEEVRSMGLPAGGVGGMKLKPKDRIVYAGVVDPAGELLTVTRAGFAKRSPLADYSAQGRNGGGIVAHKVTDKTGEVAAALVLPPQSEGDWLVFVTARGVAKPMLTVEVPAMGRSVQGKAVVELSSQDAIAAAWRIEGVKGEKSEEEKEGSRRLMAETTSSPPSSQPLRVSNSKRSREERRTTGDEKVTDRAKAASAAQQPAAEKTPAPPSGGRKPKTTASAQPKDATAPLAFEFIEQVPEVKPSGEKTDKRKSKLTAVVSVPEAQAKATKKPKG
ncbi:DNA gyrase subunit A [Caldilinea sp.]|uniref:DNA gyrase subunit A n=1 Tax=Caldilinea sp. TaxID=2293560 RepID=UPI0021DCA875|nr:DNA gyrase subunit A [Caldilinea sp.]GIV71094.1 MAG: DNA gyrase subunit A [Caldilinea sp.]